MSVRNFERVFTREVGTTPSQYVLEVRVGQEPQSAKRTSRTNSRWISKRVARQCVSQSSISPSERSGLTLFHGTKESRVWDPAFTPRPKATP
jgi:AraC-like DNA-binding protein